MDATQHFISLLTAEQRHTLLGMDTPLKIQAYLDSIPYVGEELNRTPLRVLQDRQSHCLDGGLLAAAALRRIGYPPILIDLTPEPGTDDDHVLAVFQEDGLYGAVAKSNFTGLRFREPVYRSLRELVMTYFEGFYNIPGEKTLRGYTRPIRLAPFDAQGWMWRQEGVDALVRRIYSRPSIPVLPREKIALLAHVDQRSYDAGMLGVNYDGLYKPGNNH